VRRGAAGPRPDVEYIDFDPRRKKSRICRSKIEHVSPVIGVGHVFIAVGYEYPGGPPKPWLIRFDGARDQKSRTEFFRLLPGRPEWVVLDRDPSMPGAVPEGEGQRLAGPGRCGREC
jgi:hypothetical protein